MISVILLILKIIGITVLVIIGLLLVILLAVLLVPVRYRIKASHGEAFELDAVVSWLFHLVHAGYHRSESNQRLFVRILGILVYDSLIPKKAKTVCNMNKNEDTAKDNHADIQKDMMSQPLISTKDTESEDKEITDKDIEKAADRDTIKDFDKNIEKNFKEDLKKDFVSEVKEPMQKSYLDTKKKRIFWEKLKKLYRKIKSGITNFFKNIINKIRNLFLNLSNIKRKISLILDFLRNETNKEGFRFTYDSIIRLLKHIKPTKLKSRLRFGTGDPCSTGQILGLFGILYSFYGNDLSITPEFENKVFEGSHYARGRIRLGTILIIVVRFLLDRRFKDLKMNYQLLKEAL